MAAADASAETAAIARRLASCNTGTRERALRYLLSEFLPASAPRLSATDLLKLWKGLFFCFWHADKPLYQSSVATRLASAVSAPPSPTEGAAFLAAYLTTLRREWAHIDVHRLDKFYLLNRRFLHHAFLLLHANSFAPDVTSQVVSVLSDKALLPEADNVAAATSRGLGYHVAEAFLDELLPVLPVSLETMDTLLAPFFTVLEKSTDRVMVSKVKACVFERLLDSGSRLLEMVKKGEDVEKGDPEEKLGKVGLLFGFSKRFLDIGAMAETVQSNRKVVFGLRDAFVKIEKGLQLSGLEIPAPKFEATEVPVPPNVGKGKAQKKKKKTRKAALAEDEMEDDKDLKREKKIKKEKKEKKRRMVEVVDEGDVNEKSTGSPGADQQMGDGTDGITFDAALKSNLQKQFEMVAAEAGMAEGGSSSSDSPVTPVTGKVATKRKRSKSADKLSEASDGDGGSEGNLLAQDGEKSGKKVRFSMKNNLVWRPHNPLPPQCLRLPPSATPRGSALKKGVQPGPITPTPLKKAKPKAKSAKKVLKKPPSSAVKRLRKLQSFSA
ncbi:Ribosomal RNA processing protein 1 [Zea mays]|uniref:Ribosomal RNA processing protein 1 n=1 Tax=Zea mays TaxID=4577 RepID=A0A3L6G177_MAIZE|nr:Ribosomal RNA processing protein 1 [Zea mays]